MMFTSHLFPELYNFAVVVEPKSSWRGGVVVRSLGLRSEGCLRGRHRTWPKMGTGNLMLTLTLRLTKQLAEILLVASCYRNQEKKRRCFDRVGLGDWRAYSIFSLATNIVKVSST